MWAQLIRARLQPNTGAEAVRLFEEMLAAEPAGSGLRLELVTRDQNDPGQVYVLAVFESEEMARAREQDPNRQEVIQRLNTGLRPLLAGPPEFTNLDVLLHFTPGD